MRALVLDGAPRLVRDHPEPRRGPGEALVAVRTAGVCDTDLQLARGYMSHRGVLGHEVVGEVVEADDEAWIGRRVVADINAGCGACTDCLERDGHHCANRTVLGILGRDGAFAERFVIPERNLVEVPRAVADDAAVFAEPVAAAAHVLDELGDDEREGPVVVLGDGKLGLLIALTLVGASVPVVVVGHHDEKLALARAAGARALLEGELEDPTCGVGAVPMVVEATGSATGLKRALTLVRPCGTIVLKTTVAGKTSCDLSRVVVDELRLVGSRCGDMRRAVELLASGRVDPTKLVGARYALDRADEALTHAGRRGALKVLIDAVPPGD